jgi:hypothetical protein
MTKDEHTNNNQEMLKQVQHDMGEAYRKGWTFHNAITTTPHYQQDVLPPTA